MQVRSVDFNKLPAGTYQVVIHLTDDFGLCSNTLSVHVCGLGLKKLLKEKYYEVIYSGQPTITTGIFVVKACSRVILKVDCLPNEIHFIQLIKPACEELVKASPQWQSIVQDMVYENEQTAVGQEHSGDPLWFGVRMEADLEPEMGKIGPGTFLHFGSVMRGLVHEQQVAGGCHVLRPGRRLARRVFMHPSILTNAKDYIWRSLCLPEVWAMLPQAVPLVAAFAGDRILYGIRVNFGGRQYKERQSTDADDLKIDPYTPYNAYSVVTDEPSASLLPGKLEYHVPSCTIHAVFTWGGRTTLEYPLHASQKIELLCYRAL